MAGIVFYKTNNLGKVEDFYTSELEMEVWLRQGDCIILQHGNLLLGFCQREKMEHQGIITLFYPNREKVDQMYKRLKSISTTDPEVNSKYEIYQFFAEDFEERTLEFQAFLHKTSPFFTGEELLITRRSIRNFKSKKVTREVFWDIVETSRYSPTSMNSESYNFLVIEDNETQQKLAEVRGKSSAPISEAPMAVAITADPEKTKRPLQDGCIAAYHFILAAWTHQLGTCWIADMNRKEVKRILGIPRDDYIATVTPLGYPVETPSIPQRRRKEEIATFL